VARSKKIRMGDATGGGEGRGSWGLKAYMWRYGGKYF